MYHNLYIYIDLEYSPGDVLMIQPRNDPETCKKLANLL